MQAEAPLLFHFFPLKIKLGQMSFIREGCSPFLFNIFPCKHKVKSLHIFIFMGVWPGSHCPLYLQFLNTILNPILNLCLIFNLVLNLILVYPCSSKFSTLLWFWAEIPLPWLTLCPWNMYYYINICIVIIDIMVNNICPHLTHCLVSVGTAHPTQFLLSSGLDPL